MNSGITAERVYDTLKRRLLDLDFRPGARLDPAHLSETLSSSVTPVREGLNRLRGEGLVETRTGEGFFVPQIDAPGLQDLYDWNAEILLAALRLTGSVATRPDRLVAASGLAGPLVVQTVAVFASVASLSPNPEHARAVASNSDRLQMSRIAEEGLFDDGRPEIDAIWVSLSSGVRSETRKLIVAYHRRRRVRAAEIVRALYRRHNA